MRIFPTLAGSLRFYFGVARALAVLFGVFVLFIFTLGPVLHERLFTDDPKLMIPVGEVSLKTKSTAIGMEAKTAKPGSLSLAELRGSFEADLLTDDPALASALRWTILPSVAVFVALFWLLFSSLRSLCANIERQEIFTDHNLRLLRNTGWMLIAYGAITFVVHLWASHIMGEYLTHHVALTGIPTGAGFADGLGAVRLSYSKGILSVEGSLVAGGLVLMISEAFRRGLALKSENDLTV